MALPNVNINFANGSLGTVNPPADGVSALIVKSGTASPLTLCRTYEEALAAVPDYIGNYDKEVKAFFDAGGTKLYVQGLISDSISATFNNAFMDALYNVSKGEIRLIGIYFAKSAVTEPSVAEVNALQLAADRMRTLYRAPLQFLVASNGTVNAAVGNATPAPDVSIVVGQTTDNIATYVSSIGAILGRLAASDVQVHPGRVSDGAIADAVYNVHTAVPLTNVQADALNDNGYITYRTFAGRAGYYVSDDPTLTPATDDYHSFARRRTINKAFRIANDTLTNRINTEVPTSDGKIMSDYATVLETEVETAIKKNMTAYGNLSEVNDDGGVRCEIDREWDVMGTSTIKAVLSVRPYGYAKFISVDLGFML